MRRSKTWIFHCFKNSCIFGRLEMHFSPEKAIIPKWFTFPKYFIFLALETQEWLWQISRGNRINCFSYLQIQLHFKRWNQAKTSVYIVVLFTLLCRFVYFILTTCSYTSVCILSLSDKTSVSIQRESLFLSSASFP